MGKWGKRWAPEDLPESWAPEKLAQFRQRQAVEFRSATNTLPTVPPVVGTANAGDRRIPGPIVPLEVNQLIERQCIYPECLGPSNAHVSLAEVARLRKQYQDAIVGPRLAKSRCGFCEQERPNHILGCPYYGQEGPSAAPVARATPKPVPTVEGIFSGPGKVERDPYKLIRRCRTAGLPIPIAEHRFAAPVRQWQADYCWPEHLIIVEIDGAVWTKGRHTRGQGFINDQKKLNYAAKLGFRVLRYDPSRLDECMDDLRQIFAGAA